MASARAAAMSSSSSSSDSSRMPERRAGLRGAEHVALAARLQVEPGELEAVGGGGDGGQPLPGRATPLARR